MQGYTGNMFAPPLSVASAVCERRTEPLGVDLAAPRLGWALQGSGTDRRQTAYEIRVGSKEGGRDAWASGKVASDASADVPYAGRPLRSSERLYWSVRVWDESGRASAWSRVGSWTMGVLRDADWKGRWIGSDGTSPESLLLRREFSVRKGLKRALVHVTGLGQVEMRLNGQKVGADLLAPGWTDYRKTVEYDTYDVTKMLKTGANAAGILLGNGMDNVHAGRYTKFTGTFGPQRALAQIRLEYGDGSSETVGTDDAWTAQAGPITFSSVYGGEDVDLRLEPKGWASPGFKGAWPRAKVIDGPGGTLRGLGAPAIQAFESLKPQATRTISPTADVVDLGQNASIMPRMFVSGPAGAVVRVIPAESVNADGTVNRASSGVGEAYWQVTLDGSGRVETFPKFFYHGARYLQVERSGGAVVERIEGVVVGSSSPAAGEFSSSSDLLNRERSMIRWAQRSNTMSVLTDCPHRERLGWLEQDHLNGPALRYEYGLAPLFEKIIGDMADAQHPDGLVPNIAPEYAKFGGIFTDSPEWGSAGVILPWQQYLWNRDRRTLERSYDSMSRYVDYLDSKASGNVLDYGLGDWCDLGPNPPGYAQLTPVALTATAFLYQDSAIMADAAALLGRTADAARFAARRDAVRAAFNAAFFDAAAGGYATLSQTSNAIPLAMGLVPADRRADVLASLVADVRAKGNTSGDVGFRYVLRALVEGGRSDVILALATDPTRPGYAYQIARGATSLPESWDANPSNSQNHFMLGQLTEWLYGDLAGIAPVDGFRRFRIRPTPVAGLTWVKASYRSDYGLIESAWRRVGDAVVYDVSIPPNTTASVELPGAAARTLGSGKHSFRVG